MAARPTPRFDVKLDARRGEATIQPASTRVVLVCRVLLILADRSPRTKWQRLAPGTHGSGRFRLAQQRSSARDGGGFSRFGKLIDERCQGMKIFGCAAAMGAQIG